MTQTTMEDPVTGMGIPNGVHDFFSGQKARVGSNRPPVREGAPGSMERLIDFLADLTEERYEPLEEGVLGIGARRVVMRVGALIVRQGEVAHGYSRLLG
jgi:hypothetical protein